MNDQPVRQRRSRKKDNEIKEEKVILSEKDQKFLDEDMKEADEQTKNDWLKERAKEYHDRKKNKVVVETWYCKIGSKLVKKSRNGAGSVLTNYVGNYIKNPSILTEEVKANLKG